jgi:hypothetical protein
MPLPRSLAHLKREISEKKWNEARRWAGSRASAKKYKMPREQRAEQDSGREHQEARLEALYQLKTGHCLAGQYLDWTKNRATAQCWWCRYATQTNEGAYLQKNYFCPEWKPQQKVLWALGGGAEGDGEGEGEGPVQDPGPPCRRPVQPAGAGTSSPPRMWGGGSRPPRLRTTQRAWRQNGSSGSGERGRGGEEGEAEELGAEDEDLLFSPHARLHGVRGRGVGIGGSRSFVLPFVTPIFVLSLVRSLSSWDRPGRRAKGS